MASIPPCCTIDPDLISASEKSSWCSANRATCETLCGSNPTDNECDTSTLNYTCQCGRGIQPSLANFANTVPSLMCNKWQSNCIEASGDNLAQLQQCRATECGSKDAKAEESIAQSSTGSSVATPTPSRSSTTSSIGSSLSSSFETNKAKPTPSSDTSTRSATTTPRESPTDTSNPPSETSGGTQNNNSTVGGETPPSSDGGLATGAKAGIAVGVILGVLIIVAVFFLLRRRSKKKTSIAGQPREPYKPSDEKQVAIPVASEISQKPELHSGSVVGFRPELPSEPAVGHGPNHHSNVYSDSGQWHHSQQPPAELYSYDAGHNELRGSEYASPVELHSSPRSQNVDPAIASYESVRTTQEIPPPEPVPLEVQPQQPSELTTRTRQPLSAEEIEALEEEERRIDAEMAEAQRMNELREQKFAIQQKLRDAQRR